MTDIKQYEQVSLEQFLEESKENKQTLEFSKLEQVALNLHNELLEFEASVDKFNQKNKNLFDSLIGKITQAVKEIVAEAEVRYLKTFFTLIV
jgi:hypothetical protein